jgi:hypothetical protein
LRYLDISNKSKKTASGRSEFVSGLPVRGGAILAAQARRELLSPGQALRYAIDIGVGVEPGT